MLLISLAATWYLVGLVAFVQCVAYPQFGRVGAAEFSAYHRSHTTWTTVAVLPPMVIELATAIALLAVDVRQPWRVGSLGLVVVAWAVTFGAAVPAHGRLTAGIDRRSINTLLIANAVRGVAWLGRGVLLLWVAAN